MKKILSGFLAAGCLFMGAACKNNTTKIHDGNNDKDSTAIVQTDIKTTPQKEYDLEAIAKVIDGAETVMGFSQGRASVINKEGKLGVIDKMGNIIIPFEYSYSVFKYSEGIICCHKNHEENFYFDLNGNLLFTMKDCGSGRFFDGIACVPKNGKHFYMDKTGQPLFGGQEWEWADDFSDGMALVWKDGLWGFIDTTGELVIPYKYTSPAERNPEGFHDGVAAVVIDGSRELFCYIDKTGKQIFPKLYHNDSPFCEGVAAVYDRETERYGYIDKSGNMVITLDEQCWGGNFNEGFALIRKSGGVPWGFINKSGEMVITLPEGTYRDVEPFFEGRAKVWDGNGYGFIDTTGKLVIPCEYTCYEGFSDGLVPVTKDGKCGYVDRDGNSTFNY